MVPSTRVRSAWRHIDSIESVPRRIALLCEWQLRKLEDRLVDSYYRRKGLDTVGPDFSGFDGADELRGYVSTDWRVIRKLFPRGSVGPEDVLLEYGSGKGRVAVWIASRFKLRRVIGVELDQDLTTASQANLENWTGPLLCQDVAFTCADAREFEVPDDVTIVYMFNPFMGEVFDQALAQLLESLARTPRRLRIVYFYPIMHAALVDAGFTVERMHRHALYAYATYRMG